MGHFGPFIYHQYSGQVLPVLLAKSLLPSPLGLLRLEPLAAAACPLCRLPPCSPRCRTGLSREGGQPAAGVQLSCSAWGFGWGADGRFTNTGYQLFTAVACGYSGP